MNDPIELRQMEELRDQTLRALTDIRKHIDRFEKLLDDFEEGVLERLDQLEGWTGEASR